MESSSGGNNSAALDGRGGSKSSLSRKFTGATLSSRKGVQKFYTKIRHKIEDSMPPKITAKLNKNIATTSLSSSTMPTKNHSSPERSSKPKPPPRVLATNKKRKHLTNGGMELENHQSIVNTKFNPKCPCYENVRVSSNPNELVDTDEECQTSLNDSTLSLEDEIFEELEKVAHDEAKLNSVLKNFDKILADFSGPTNKAMTTSTPTLKLCNSASYPINSTPTVTESKKTDTKSEGKTFPNHKPLQKSKTCSIIESRCILKKSLSDSTQNDERSIKSFSISDELQHFAALQVTKSLWNLQDFEVFAKSGKQFNKFDYGLPVLKPSDSDYKLAKSSSPETPSNNDKNKSTKQINKVNPVDISNRVVRSHLPRATSVWEVSSCTSLANLHPLCTRTSSGSKIPVKKISPQRLIFNGRSNSFCNQSLQSTKLTTSPSPSSILTPSKTNTTATLTSPQKIIQIGKVLPTPKRTPGKITTVNKIVKNLNELSRNGNGCDVNRTTDIVKRPGSTNSSVSPISSTTVRSTLTATTNLANKKYNRHINAASSTPHSLNKTGISVKASSSTVTLSSAATASSATAVSPKSTKTYLKNANSELSLNTLKSVRTLSGGNKVNNLTATSKKTQQSDFLLYKCLEKGQEILRKVEAFGSVTKLERSKEYSKSGHQLQQLATVQILQQRSKEIKNAVLAGQKATTVIKSTSSSTVNISTGQNQQCDDIENKFIPSATKKHNSCTSLSTSPVLQNNTTNLTKASSENTVDGCSLPIGKLQKILPQICYAKECTIQFPRLESCKIIPPLLCHPSQQHAELLVNVKTTQQPLRVHQDSMLCINSDIIRSEKEYHSDCSEDSGHISNENDDLSTPFSTGNDDKVSKSSTNNKNNTNLTSNCSGDVLLKGVKISELLEKFESAASKDSLSSSSSAAIQFLSTSLSLSSSSHQDDHNHNGMKKQCTTIKVAEVKPVKCITSSMEIYPTYSSEVIIQIQ